jgi:hypothetical protein
MQLPYPEEAWKEIPKIFWSDLSQLPFQTCLMCNCNFEESQQPYLIEKAVKGMLGDQALSTVFEYAVCLSCAEQMNLSLSESSRLKIAQYFEANIHFNARREALEGAEQSAWIENCLVKKRPLREQEECQLYAFCVGDKMLYHEFPYMITGEALDEMLQLLSAKTLDILNGFKDDFFDGPPELKELLEKGGPKVLL